MKKILLLITTVLFISCSDLEKNLYCGKVVEKFRTDAGYKSSAQAHVVFYNDNLKRNIDVQVTWNTYANTYIGQNVCFELLKYQVK